MFRGAAIVLTILVSTHVAFTLDATTLRASRQTLAVVGQKTCGRHDIGSGRRSSCPAPKRTTNLERGMKVDVGGYKLFIRCTGHGAPTVILDSGLGATTDEWTFPDGTRDQVQQLTRVCVYDRAGLGRSDRRPRGATGTAARVVRELSALLANARVTGPYVVVGHSMGGINMRLFAYSHRPQVVGVVLVDASNEHYCAQLKRVAPRLPSQICEGKSRNGERYDILASYAQLRRATHGVIKGSLGNLPLVILTHGIPYTGFVGARELETAWGRMQRELATASSNSVHVVALSSGHVISVEQPRVVVEAIREVVMAARRPPHRLPACGRAFTQLDSRCAG